MFFRRFFSKKIKHKENIRKLEDPEILKINISELNEKIYTPLQEVKVVRHLSDAENQAIFQEILSAYSNFPTEIKRLFRYKVSAIYYLPDEYNESAWTLTPKTGEDKKIIVINAKALKWGIEFILIHELGHCLDFNNYPAYLIPQWAWDFLEKFEEIIKKEPEPIEGVNRDKERYFFDERKEEFASRLAATIMALYLPKAGMDFAITRLRSQPLTIPEFVKKYPQSYKFFKKFLKKIESEISDKERQK